MSEQTYTLFEKGSFMHAVVVGADKLGFIPRMLSNMGIAQSLERCLGERTKCATCALPCQTRSGEWLARRKSSRLE